MSPGWLHRLGNFGMGCASGTCKLATKYPRVIRNCGSKLVIINVNSGIKAVSSSATWWLTLISWPIKSLVFPYIGSQIFDTNFTAATSPLAEANTMYRSVTGRPGRVNTAIVESLTGHRMATTTTKFGIFRRRRDLASTMILILSWSRDDCARYGLHNGQDQIKNWSFCVCQLTANILLTLFSVLFSFSSGSNWQDGIQFLKQSRLNNAAKSPYKIISARLFGDHPIFIHHCHF